MHGELAVVSWQTSSREGSAHHITLCPRHMSTTKAPVVDVTTFFSAEAHRLQNASLSGLVGQFAGIPDVIALHAGLPPPVSFPVQAFQLDLVPAQGAAEESLEESKQPDPTAQQHNSDTAAQTQHGAPTSCIHVTDTAVVTAAQQYCFSAGYPPLLNWITNTMSTAHSPPYSMWACAVTAGAVHALSLAASLLLQPGDWLLMDEFTYSHALEVVFVPKGARPLPVRMDSDGMDPAHLRAVLAGAKERLSDPGHAWDDGLPAPTRPPRMVYLIPTGHNPTGITMSLKRKQELYQVCRDHHLLILEDDAYWWMYWGEQPPTRTTSTTGGPGLQESHHTGQAGVAPHAAPLQPDTQTHTSASNVDSSAESWYSQLPRSFLSLDTDGRVLRVDTLAKVLGPGYRLGWVTGQKALVDKFALAAQASCVGPCPLAQVLVSQLLTSWGVAGWAAHLSRLRAVYQTRARALEAAVTEHLSDLVVWRGVPGAGMFMWLQILPDASGRVPSAERLSKVLLESKVVAVPGSMCWADLGQARAGADCPFLRLTFALLEPSQLQEGVRRLAKALKAAQSERQQ